MKDLDKVDENMFKDALEIAEVIVSWIETKLKIAHTPRPEGE